MQEVDKVLDRICGVCSLDLSDYCYRDAYDDGRTPSSVARAALRNSGGE